MPLHHLIIAEDIKRINALGFRTWLITELTIAFREARKNKLGTFNEHQYEVNWQENIVQLADSILQRTYEPSGSVSFIIFDPMVREIFAAPFRDRVVHHFLYRMQAEWWDRRFIYDSYSCREGKGTLFGIERVQKMMKQASNDFTKDAYVLKNDIKGYFMSLPRKKLYLRIKWGLDKQFAMFKTDRAGYELYMTCLFLWHQVIMDDPAPKSYRRGNASDWESLPPEKSLYNRDAGQGIVIGNLTSQLASNIYLDQLDRYIKYDLGYEYYGRYVDDFVRIVPAEQYEKALRDNKKIEAFMRDNLELTLHSKKVYVQPVDKGVNFIGCRIYPHTLYPSNRLQQKLDQAVRKFVETKGANMATLLSYLGLMQHLNAHKFIKKVFARYGLDYSLYLTLRKYDNATVEAILRAILEDRI